MATMRDALSAPQGYFGGIDPSTQTNINAPAGKIDLSGMPGRLGSFAGGMVGSLAGPLGSALGSGFGGYAAGMTPGGAIGQTLGTAIGSAFGPVGALVGGFIGNQIGTPKTPQQTKAEEDYSLATGGWSGDGGGFDVGGIGNDASLGGPSGGYGGMNDFA